MIKKDADDEHGAPSDPTISDKFMQEVVK